MQGRLPGNYQNESPDLKLLSEGDLKFPDNAGGNVPPLVGARFFGKEQGIQNQWTIQQSFAMYCIMIRNRNAEIACDLTPSVWGGGVAA